MTAPSATNPQNAITPSGASARLGHANAASPWPRSAPARNSARPHSASASSTAPAIGKCTETGTCRASISASTPEPARPPMFQNAWKPAKIGRP
ncbi:hypothetical protein [Amycolatopsis sp. NPDC051061]|uniref:hypothetical protein n=1 Tax=Amycolatopsis sp. NPDC051061 TaxID=3155042 RepID=UPI003436F82B